VNGVPSAATSGGAGAHPGPAIQGRYSSARACAALRAALKSEIRMMRLSAPHNHPMVRSALPAGTLALRPHPCWRGSAARRAQVVSSTIIHPLSANILQLSRFRSWASPIGRAKEAGACRCLFHQLTTRRPKVRVPRMKNRMMLTPRPRKTHCRSSVGSWTP